MYVLPLAAAALRSDSVTPPVIRSPLQQIYRTSIFAKWRSTTRQFSTEQIMRDRKLGTETKLNIRWIFKVKKTPCWRQIIFHCTTLTKHHNGWNQAWSQQIRGFQRLCTHIIFKLPQNRVVSHLKLYSMPRSKNVAGGCRRMAEHEADTQHSRSAMHTHQVEGLACACGSVTVCSAEIAISVILFVFALGIKWKHCALCAGARSHWDPHSRCLNENNVWPTTRSRKHLREVQNETIAGPSSDGQKREWERAGGEIQSCTLL